VAPEPADREVSMSDDQDDGPSTGLIAFCVVFILAFAAFGFIINIK
jgi:hypothetical protein